MKNICKIPKILLDYLKLPIKPKYHPLNLVISLKNLKLFLFFLHFLIFPSINKKYYELLNLIFIILNNLKWISCLYHLDIFVWYFRTITCFSTFCTFMHVIYHFSIHILITYFYLFRTLSILFERICKFYLIWQFRNIY